ncbi:MAG: DUF6515 family protein [Rikenellaceae bacterium]
MRNITLLSALLFALAVSTSSISYAQKQKPSQPAKVVKKVPRKNTPITYKGNNYFLSHKKFYKPSGGKFTIVRPPFGMRVPIIPAVHLAFVFNSQRYYSAKGVIYQEVDNNEYVVVEPQAGMVVPELPEANVNTVEINGKTYYEFDTILYKQIPTVDGLQYEVVGSLDD